MKRLIGVAILGAWFMSCGARTADAQYYSGGHYSPGYSYGGYYGGSYHSSYPYYGSHPSYYNRYYYSYPRQSRYRYDRYHDRDRVSIGRRWHPEYGWIYW